MCSVPTYFFFCFHTSYYTLFICLLPKFFTYNSFVLTICKNVFLLMYLAVFILSAFDFFSCSSAKSDFPRVHRVVDYHSDKMRTPLGKSTIGTFDFLDTLQIKIVCNFIKSHITIYIFIKDNSYRFCFIFLDIELLVFEVVTIKSKPTVASSTPSLHFSPVHCLN